ncbi:hypothetical protein ABTN27_20405, partial [Acinetobacter baumannii]
MRENPIRSLPGIPVLLVLLAALLAGGFLLLTGASQDAPARAVAGVAVAVVAFFLMFGLYMVEPNQAAVLSLFGKYVGTV